MSFKLPRKFNPGAFPDRPDERDYKYSEVCGSPEIDWHKGFNVEKELDTQFKIEAQNGSLSCVGQAWSKYGEVLDCVETKQGTDLSAKSIYEQIYLPSGGAYLREGAKTVVKGGVSRENWTPSYDNGQPPSEEFMRKITITSEIREKMKKYQAKEYRTIGSGNVDLIAHAIQNNWGAVSGALGDNKGWKDWRVKPPTSSKPWGHAYYYYAFGMDTVGKYFDFINSWGDKWGRNGKGRMYFENYDMPNNTFGVWTLVDKPNTSTDNQIETLKVKGKPEIFAKSKTENKLYWIGGWESCKRFENAGWMSSFYEVDKLPQGYQVIWEPFGFIK